MNKRVPKRQCVGCRVSKDKKELVRVVKEKDGTISIDRSGKKNGRGAYICNSIECLEKAIKNKAFHRSFQLDVPDDVYQHLYEEMKNNEE